MKIKQTRQVRLDELMKYVWDNGITRTRFEGKDCSIYVDDKGNFKVADEYSLCKSDLYTIAEEVEVTEDTILDRFVHVLDSGRTKDVKNNSISKIIKLVKNFDSTVEFVYLQNEDGSTGDLIWKAGKFIE